MADATTIGEAVSAWEDIGPTLPLHSSGRRRMPSARTLEIVGKIGLRFPPANSVDREAHAARVALLAEDCADIDPDLLDATAREWAQRERFFPKAVELRELARSIAIVSCRDKALPAPPRHDGRRPFQPPLTDAEIARLPDHFVAMGVRLGEFTQERADKLRAERWMNR